MENFGRVCDNQLENSGTLQLGLTRLIERGRRRSPNHVSQAAWNKRPEILWRKIVGMYDRLIQRLMVMMLSKLIYYRTRFFSGNARRMSELCQQRTT